MDDSQLRLWILVAGVVLVAAIYLWDRFKRWGGDAGIHWLGAFNAWLGAWGVRLGKRVSALGARLSERRRRSLRARGGTAEQDAPGDPARYREQVSATSNDVTARREPVLSGGPSADKSNPEAARTRVIVVNVEAPVGGSYSGDALVSAARDVSLDAGEMEIYHRHADQGDNVIFSMVNVVKPGTFPFANMSGFETPGVALFAQLPGNLSAVDTYDLMLSVAQRLAALLGGQVRDAGHRLLTEEIIDHERLDLTRWEAGQ
ncbi:MAG: cell division protein ZipA [Pseudomonadota bacterium]